MLAAGHVHMWFVDHPSMDSTHFGCKPGEVKTEPTDLRTVWTMTLWLGPRGSSDERDGCLQKCHLHTSVGIGKAEGIVSLARPRQPKG